MEFVGPQHGGIECPSCIRHRFVPVECIDCMTVSFHRTLLFLTYTWCNLFNKSNVSMRYLMYSTRLELLYHRNEDEHAIATL